MVKFWSRSDVGLRAQHSIFKHLLKKTERQPQMGVGAFESE